MIPFYDLPSENKIYINRFKKNIYNIFNSAKYILGTQVHMFEKNFAKYCGVKYCIAVSSGFDALNLSFKSLIIQNIIKPKDEVIVAANSYIATILSITINNLIPKFVDVDESTFNLNTRLIEKNITKKTKVILALHLYGLPCNMKVIKKIAIKYDLLVIEDCAQAHGSKINNTKVGNFGDLGCFSFFPGKNLGAIGDAGAITTNNYKHANILKSIRNYGEKYYNNISDRKYENFYQGINSRMDELHALILNLKLKNLDKNNFIRHKISKRYINEIQNPNIILPVIPKFYKHVWHLFVIKSNKRNKLLSFLKENKIETRIHYPIPPFKQKAFFKYNNLKFKNTENLSKTILSIPLRISLTKDSINKVISTINKFV